MRPWKVALLPALVLALPPGAAAQSKPRPRGTLALGDTVRDSLTRRDVLLAAESTYAQEWRLAGRAGQTVTTTQPASFN